MILVIDQRKGAMREDGSNMDVDPAEYDRLLSRAQSGTEPSAVIHVNQDGIFVVDGVATIEVVTVKSEAELSREKADTQLEARRESTREVKPAHTVAERLRGVFTDDR